MGDNEEACRCLYGYELVGCAERPGGTKQPARNGANALWVRLVRDLAVYGPEARCQLAPRLPSGVGSRQLAVSSSASSAATSSAASTKSTSAFSAMRDGVVDFGSGRTSFSSR